MKKPEQDKFFIQSINRALTIVDAISKSNTINKQGIDNC